MMDDIHSEAAAAERLCDICRERQSCDASDEFKALIERFPNAVRVKISCGGRPLHYACRNGCLEVIPILIASWPHSVQIGSNLGSLPLHFACHGRSSLAVIQLLVEAWPDAAHIQNIGGWIPLHNACSSECTVEVVQFLLNCWPESVRCRTKVGKLPLHNACWCGHLLKVQLLIKAWPDSVREKDDEGKLPLHYAFESHCSGDVVQFLVESWPQSMQIADNRGSLPLHNAVRNKYWSLAVIQALVQAWPDAVRLQDDDDWLPLHIALQYGTDDVIQFLVYSWPESCHIPTSQGKLPLHLACDWNRASDLILFLIHCGPQAVRCKDSNLQLPLHIACQKQYPIEMEVTERLIKEWPASIQIPCPFPHEWSYTHKTDENEENDGDDEDSDLEHHDNGLIGNGVVDNSGGDGGNDDHTLKANKRIQCNALPLDLACAQIKRPSPEIILLLTNNMPPLHFLCTNAAEFWGPGTMATMEYLISIFPGDSKLFYHGMLPFHCACRAGARFSLLKWWWDKSPNIVQVITTDTGDTSLHCYLSSTYAALGTKASKRERKQALLALQFLVEKHPDALRKVNRMGMLPFHVAAIHQAPLDVIFYVACQNPEALLYCCQNFDVSHCAHPTTDSQVARKRKFANVSDI